jgi:hypothetical protein
MCNHGPKAYFRRLPLYISKGKPVACAQAKCRELVVDRCAVVLENMKKEKLEIERNSLWAGLANK